MRQTYNIDAIDKKDKITAGPEWVERDVVDMWYRIDEKAKEKRISYTKAGRKYGFSPSSVYNTIAAVKRGLAPRDTDLRIIEALAREMNVPLNYLVHGKIDEMNESGSTCIDESVLDNIFALGNGNYLSLFLLSLPYLGKEKIASIKEDITIRIK